MTEINTDCACCKLPISKHDEMMLRCCLAFLTGYLKGLEKEIVPA